MYHRFGVFSIYEFFSGRIEDFGNLACVKHLTNSMSVAYYCVFLSEDSICVKS